MTEERLMKFSERQENEKKLKNKKYRLLKICIFLGIILLPFTFWLIMNIAYSFTQVPDGLTAQQTVEQYFKYWDSGNQKGQNLILTDYLAAEYVPKDGALVTSGNRRNLKWNESFSFHNLRDDVKITEITQCKNVPDSKRYDSFAETVVFSVCYSKSIDDGWQGLTKGQNFTYICVCRETENSPWRIDSFFTGW